MLIGDIIENYPRLAGLYSVVSNRIDKYGVLCLLKKAYNVSTIINPVDIPQFDWSLDGTKFRKATGYVAPSWSEMIKRMAEDTTPYIRQGNRETPL